MKESAKKIKVIIPSAKLVPEELQLIGKLPAIIYPINQRIVFDYLYEQYAEQCYHLDVICYENAEKVHRRLEKYLDERIFINDLEYLGDLGNTVYHGIKDYEGTIVINFSDTIVMEPISKLVGNSFFYAEGDWSEKWTFFETDDERRISIFDKVEINKRGKGKIFVGVFQIEDAQFFKKCLERAFTEKSTEMSTFYYALCLYNEVYTLRAFKTDSWFDIGHIDTYYTSNLEVKAREFNHISIDKNRGILRKTSDDRVKFIGEIEWYLKLPVDLKYVSPRIFDYSIEFENPYVSMEYYAYHTVHELFLYGELSYHQWFELFGKIRFVCSDFRRYKVDGDKVRSSLKEMYLKKTMDRLEKVRENNELKPFWNKSIVINGHRYKSLKEISNILIRIIPDKLYDVSSFPIIHGDLCFTNILVDNNISFIKMIDPRGKFGEYDIYGDFRYELAKLLHSIDGKYDFIIKDLFTVEYDLNSARVDFTINDKTRDYDLYKIFLDVFQDEICEDLEKIELIEALLFLSMIPLHNESIEHQVIMLGTGIEILNRVIDVQE